MGAFLTICYCFRTIGCCYPYCFLEIFVGGQDLDGGNKVVVGAIVFLLFSGNFCGARQGLDGGGQSRDGGSQVPHWGKPCRLIFLVPDPLL